MNRLKNSSVVSDQPSQNDVAQIIQNIDPSMNCDSKQFDVIVLEQETKLQKRVIHAQQQQIENQQKQIEELTKKIQNNL
jgi:DNA-binding protein H-NS